MTHYCDCLSEKPTCIAICTFMTNFTSLMSNYQYINYVLASYLPNDLGFKTI